MTENKQSESENKQSESENKQSESENKQKKPINIDLTSFIPRIPAFYPQKPILRRVAFLCMAVFLWPVICALVLSLSFIMLCYWLLRVIFG